MKLADTQKAIKDAWVAGLVTIVVNLALTLIYASGPGLAHIDAWNIADFFILGGLTFGVYRKNRWAAILLLVYYLASKLVFWVGERAFIGVPLALIFCYFFWRGIRGTWAYHQSQVAIDA